MLVLVGGTFRESTTQTRGSFGGTYGITLSPDVQKTKTFFNHVDSAHLYSNRIRKPHPHLAHQNHRLPTKPTNQSTTMGANGAFTT